MTTLGIALIAHLDLVVPAALIAGLVVLNVRGHRARRTEVVFWIWAAVALVVPITLGIQAIVELFDYEGGLVIPVTMTTIPGSLAPIIATVGLSRGFFDDQSWADSAYFVVMPVFVAGAILWQLFVIVAIRRIVQDDRARTARRRLLEGTR